MTQVPMEDSKGLLLQQRHSLWRAVRQAPQSAPQGCQGLYQMFIVTFANRFVLVPIIEVLD